MKKTGFITKLLLCAIFLSVPFLFSNFRFHSQYVIVTRSQFGSFEDGIFSADSFLPRDVMNSSSNQSITWSPKPPPYTQQESFAACILVLDQNHRLTEWIAYHYFALPLRTLIIAYDPKTNDRATQLLERWRDVIEIIEWEDKDYLPPQWTKRVQPGIHGTKNLPPDVALPVAIHRQRQISFMHKCTQAVAAKNVARVIHHDVDEYFRVNTNVVSQDLVNTAEPGHITQFLNRLEQAKSTLFPSAKGIAYGTSCSVFPRLQYTPIAEETNRAKSNRTHPIDPYYFDTLRYPYRNSAEIMEGKGIINMKLIPPRALKDKTTIQYRVHKPLNRLCKESTPNSTLFVFNHYMGSFESFLYSARNDPRNEPTRAKWEERVQAGGGMGKARTAWQQDPPLLDDAITNWVPAFVEWQSEEVASWLLRDTGLRAVDWQPPPVNSVQ
jgi:hypothetical protein